MTYFEQTRNYIPLGTLQTKYERFLVSGFIEDFFRIGQKLPIIP